MTQLRPKQILKKQLPMSLSNELTYIIIFVADKKTTKTLFVYIYWCPNF